MATPSASVTIQTIPSKRAASPHPVTASAPKEFTVDCTMMLEIEYNDDWTANGRPVASMLRQMERSMPSRRGSSLHAPWARMSLTITIEALMVMVNAVAIPHPSASIKPCDENEVECDIEHAARCDDEGGRPRVADGAEQRRPHVEHEREHHGAKIAARIRQGLPHELARGAHEGKDGG